MRIPLGSPLSPDSDTVPIVQVGRTSQLNDWRDVLCPRCLSGIHERSRTVLGETGSGKFPFVRRVTREAFEAGDWVIPQLYIPPGTNPIKRVASVLLELASTVGLPAARERYIGDLLRRIETVAAPGISLSVHAPGGPGACTALTDPLVETGRSVLW